MNITRKTVEESEPRGIPVQDIPIDTVFDGRVRGSLHDQGPLLRVYDGIVDLVNPGNIWIGIRDRCLDFQIINYRPLKVELVIHGPA